MKKFTAEDIGKTFKTSQEGVTATLMKYDGTYIGYRFHYSNGDKIWMTSDGTRIDIESRHNVFPDQEVTIPSEADLLRKEIEELKAKHEADLRTAIEMARDGYVTDEAFMLYDNTPDEILNKILNNHGNT
jgi:hypothetical protein